MLKLNQKIRENAKGTLSMLDNGGGSVSFNFKVGFKWGRQVGEPLETSPPEACANEGREGCEPFRS